MSRPRRYEHDQKLFQDKKMLTTLQYFTSRGISKFKLERFTSLTQCKSYYKPNQIGYFK